MAQARKTTALGIAVVLGWTTAAGAWESAGLAQLPKGDPARKLAVLHHQEALLEQLVTGVCYVDAGVDPDRHRAAVYAARDGFEATLPDIVEEVNRLDPSHPATRRMQSEIGKKTERWYRLRVFFERELKADKPSADALFQIAGLEEGLAGTIEHVYKLVRRDMVRSGQVSLAETIEENAGFTRLFLAQRLVKETCLVAVGAGGAVERAKLGEAIEHFEQLLQAEAGSIAASAAVKALIPEWQALMPEIRALLGGQAAAPDLLARADALLQRWVDASGAAALQTKQG